jgi:hypothetical protein
MTGAEVKTTLGGGTSGEIPGRSESRDCMAADSDSKAHARIPNNNGEQSRGAALPVRKKSSSRGSRDPRHQEILGKQEVVLPAEEGILPREEDKDPREEEKDPRNQAMLGKYEAILPARELKLLSEEVCFPCRKSASHVGSPLPM